MERRPGAWHGHGVAADRPRPAETADTTDLIRSSLADYRCDPANYKLCKTGWPGVRKVQPLTNAREIALNGSRARGVQLTNTALFERVTYCQFLPSAMDLNDVVFLGGPYPKFGSVQIRCVDIARYLGCAYLTNVTRAEDVPLRYKAFICVKARLKDSEFTKLAQRGAVVWDIIDNVPEARGNITAYLVSTRTAQSHFSSLGDVRVIYHYHCNFEGTPNEPTLRRAGWVGSIHWYPGGIVFPHDVYDTAGKTREEIAAAYRKVGIGLNLRAKTPGHELHATINSGIKLINCLGFGIPSVSESEPPYLEIGENCTLFADREGFIDAIQGLVENPLRYDAQRKHCLDLARRFHVASIADEYRRFIRTL